LFDTIILGARIIDGRGEDSFRSDIGISDGSIVRIGNLKGQACKRLYDLSQYCLAPGFIDLHTHSGFPLLLDGRALSSLFQGVTTQVIGNCGFSPAPLAKSEHLKRNVFCYREPFHPSWRSFGEFLEVLQSPGLGTNVIPLVGHGAIRSRVIGFEARRAESREIGTMVEEVERAMEEGAFGLSSGLEYSPGAGADEEELVSLCGAVAKCGGIYTTHVRNRDERYRSGFSEAFRVAERSGVSLQISHAVPKYGAPAEATEWLLEELHRRRTSIDVGCDVIPYEWGPTSLTAMLPKDLLENTPEELAGLLSRESVRSTIRKQRRPFWLLFRDRLWERILLYHSPSFPELNGKNAQEIGDYFGTDPFNGLLEVLMREGEQMFSVLIMGRIKERKALTSILYDGRTAVISDALSLANEGPLADFRWSPGCYGWIPHFLNSYAGAGRLLSVEEAVRRLTSLPASIMGISDRGVVEEGFRADLTAFKADEIEAAATLDNPSEYARGFDYTWCNGDPIVEAGVFTGVRSGQVISPNRSS
jgi:N-acyl-D-aspartate/D-glutamate deacylase